MKVDKTLINKQFYKFVIPSVFSLALTGIYCFVDAFFVGNMVGDTGLAAINISFAFISLSYSVGCGIGAGCSVKYSICKAQGKNSDAKDYIGALTMMSFICSMVITIPMLLFPKQIMLALGASTLVSEIGKPYLFINGLGTTFQIFGVATVPVVRNCGYSIFAMVSVVSGCVFNIVLDWLFVWVFHWGIKGAAYATVLGQIFATLFCIIVLTKTNNMQYKCSNFKQKVKDIIKIGISPFGLCLIPNVSVVILNKASLYYGGDPAIAAYGCMAYLVYVIYLIMQGVGEGVQPMISTFHGNGNKDGILYVRKKMFILTTFLAFFSFVLEFFFSEELAKFMGSSGTSAQIIKKGLPVLACGFFFVGLSRNIAACLYAQEMNVKSYIISYSEPILILLCLIILPKSMALDSVWLSNTIAQFAVFILAIFLMASKTQQKQL